MIAALASTLGTAGILTVARSFGQPLLGRVQADPELGRWISGAGLLLPSLPASAAGPAILVERAGDDILRHPAEKLCFGDFCRPAPGQFRLCLRQAEFDEVIVVTRTPVRNALGRQTNRVVDPGFKCLQAPEAVIAPVVLGGLASASSWSGSGERRVREEWSKLTARWLSGGVLRGAEPIRAS